jgi:hypothetical protein
MTLSSLTTNASETLGEEHLAQAYPPTQLAFTNACLLDTGPLVARLDHDLDLRGARLLTTGAVVTEAFYFLSNIQNGPTGLFSRCERDGGK